MTSSEKAGFVIAGFFLGVFLLLHGAFLSWLLPAICLAIIAVIALIVWGVEKLHGALTKLFDKLERNQHDTD